MQMRASAPPTLIHVNAPCVVRPWRDEMHVLNDDEPLLQTPADDCGDLAAEDLRTEAPPSRHCLEVAVDVRRGLRLALGVRAQPAPPLSEHPEHRSRSLLLDADRPVVVHPEEAEVQ